MTLAQSIIIATIVAYLGAMLLIGLYFSRKGSADSSDEFYIGGRSLGPIVTAMSAEASDMSSYLLMGLPGLAYISGVAECGWTIIGLAGGTYLNFLLVAKLLRRYSAEINAITIPEYFSKRYGDTKHTISLISALIIIIFFIPYTASGFKAVGTLFNSLFGVEYHAAMIAGAIVIVTYTALGGFMAVSTTDLIQSIFMTIALVIIVFFGIEQAGGMNNVVPSSPRWHGVSATSECPTSCSASWRSVTRTMSRRPAASRQSGASSPWLSRCSSASSATAFPRPASSRCWRPAPIPRLSSSSWQMS